MSRIICSKSLLICLAGVALLASWLVGGHSNGAAQDKENKKDPGPAAPGLTKLFFGVKACSDGGCHAKIPGPKEDFDFVCRYNEVLTWQKEDKHKDANKVLKNERSQQMARLLAIKGDISTERTCITCHGAVNESDAKAEKKLAARFRFNLEDGVSCVVCHGPYEEWVNLHQLALKRDEWRGFTRQEKQLKFGMTDLWDPVKRATKCASCHVGNLEEGKVVTHAMYAAGHPPLPGLEAATFSDAMPRHWDYIRDKKADIQKLFWKEAWQYKELEQTQLVVLSSVVSFRETLKLIGGLAKEQEKKGPELAAFDCYACHHELRTPSWRQERGYPGRPGRPPLRPWSLALMPLAVKQAAGGKPGSTSNWDVEYRAKVRALNDAFDAQPFGDPQKVARAALDAADWLDRKLLPAIQKGYTETSALELLGFLKEIVGKEKYLDYDSARQVSWACKTIKSELEPGKKEALGREFAPLDKLLKLELPRGQVEISGELVHSLRIINDYKPEDFRKAFAELFLKKTR
jgi:hypothetical protein